MINRRLYILAFICLATLSCEYISTSTDTTTQSEPSEIVAQVGSSILTRSDIANLVNSNTSEQDSLLITNRYVQNWLKKELLVKKANQNMRIDMADIEKKVADYRYALISYEYQKLKVEQELDTVVSEEEIAQYYDQNKENFSLRQNIFRGRFIKVSQQAQKLNNVKRWIKSSRPNDLESLRSYAFQFADNYSLEDSTWIKFDDIIKNSPFSTISNKIQFLRSNRYVEETDSLYLYLLKINEYKISEELSPLEFVKDDIRDIIINKRKIELVKRLENEIYEQAKENEDYQVFR